MTEATSKRTNVAAFLAILLISAATMIVLFWRFPLTTALFTIGAFVLLGLSARLARAMDVADVTEVQQGEPSL